MPKTPKGFLEYMVVDPADRGPWLGLDKLRETFYDQNMPKIFLDDNARYYSNGDMSRGQSRPRRDSYLATFDKMLTQLERELTEPLHREIADKKARLEELTEEIEILREQLDDLNDDLEAAQHRLTELDK